MQLLIKNSITPSIVYEPGVSPGCYLAINNIAFLPFPIVIKGQDNFEIVLHNSFTSANYGYNYSYFIWSNRSFYKII